jgi:hypothetical protein
MNRFAFWIRWLIVASAGVVVFGLMLAFFPNMPLLGPINDQLETVFALDPPSPGFRPFQHWIYGAWGATIAGWGLLVSFTVWLPLRKKERWAWYALTSSLLLWFLVDSGLSLLFRITDNVILNTLFLLLLGTPLLALRAILLSDRSI